MSRTIVHLEIGQKRVFASALDWPGWSRAAKGEQQALEALSAYARRYAPVAASAGLALPDPADFDVVERSAGTASTEFGVPGVVAAPEREPLVGPEAERGAALVAASWTVFDRVVAGAPAELRKGPRGGGRDRDRIVAHVLGAEVGYGRALGLRLREPAPGDAAAVAAHREAIAGMLRAARDGTPLAPKGWPPRYAARRIAWHVLDHAWEIEDRSEP